MISRSALSRGTQLALRSSGAAKIAQRGFAVAASEKVSYEPTNIAGVKVAARDDGGPTTRLAIIAKAGTRYEALPGLTVGLEEFAFKARQLSVEIACAAAAGACLELDELICVPCSEHHEAFRPPYHPRIRASRWPIDCLPHPGSPGLAGQLPPRGSPVLHGAPCRGYLRDEIH